MRCLIVINSLSTKATQIYHRAKSVIDAYEDHDIEIKRTKSAGDSFRFAYKATFSGIDLILACGGDGTLNEVVNGAYNANPKHKIIFAQHACGSANDLAKSIGSKSFIEDLENLLDAQYLNIDCAHISKEGRIRKFVNESTGGMGALVCRDVDSLRHSLPPKLNYLWHSILWIVRFKRPLIEIEFDGQTIRERVLLVVFGKGNFVGNGLGFTPQATLTNGKLGITVVTTATLWKMLRYRPKLVRNKRIESDEITYTSANRIKLSVVEGRLPIETDGEFFDILFEGESIEYAVTPGCMRLCF